VLGVLRRRAPWILLCFVLVAERLHETLIGAGAPLLGVIANGFKAGRRGGYGCGYGYDYAPTKSKQPSSESASPNGAASAEAPVPTVEG